MDQPLVCGGGQGHAGQEQDVSTLHPGTSAQQDCRLDGTPMVPGCNEHRVALGVVEGILRRVGVKKPPGPRWFLLDRLALGEHGVELLHRDTEGLDEFGS